jgi:outer membrane immunogenic protein
MAKRKIHLLGTTALASAGLFAGAAGAADMVVKARPVAPAATWSGCYVGLNAGAASTRTTEQLVLPNDPTVHLGDTDSGFTGGAQVGCNYQVDRNWVFGIEGDINFLGAKNKSSAFFRARDGEDTYGTGQTRVRSLTTLRGQLGYVWNQAMFYGTAGLAEGDVKSSFSALSNFQSNNPISSSGSRSGFRSGWVAGGGIAAQLTNKVSAKFEYLHFDLGRFSYSVIGGSEIWNATTKVSGDMVRFGLNYKISP